MVSVRKTVIGLPDFSWTIFPLHHVHNGNIYPRLRVRATLDVLIFPPRVRMYLSLMLVRAQFSSVDAYSTRFWAYLLPQTRSARVLTLGRTASEAPPYR